ncbi:alpha-(1,3)-fucosyltransferase C-like [Oppia nitens]|uniref:alpha-(1,3)-fucosyltransferase C-like n=1 Tax=Oppia nitens TaxID=1686743 RepID=UPI0023DCA514|nr:alpha-(1,3)-fucosyltransferase C-like [Oppia nitens]
MLDEFNSSDVILFHWRDIDIRDQPTDKLFDQKWVLYNMESPMYTYMSYPNRLFNIRLFESIDWTMTYRTDSDIYIPYGTITKCQQKWRPKVKPFRTKRRSIAWVVSNCETASKREYFVDQIKTLMEVDVFGACGTYECSRSDDSCFKYIEKHYKYYLAFENSLCKDYVTEKLFHSLNYDIIPVVYGVANYSSILPPNSYIDALKFITVSQLVDHLNQVANDQNLYESYFQWKHYYCVQNSNDFCQLCQYINEYIYKSSDNSVNRDIVKWWVNDAHCRSIKFAK